MKKFSLRKEWKRLTTKYRQGVGKYTGWCVGRQTRRTGNEGSERDQFREAGIWKTKLKLEKGGARGSHCWRTRLQPCWAG